MAIDLTIGQTYINDGSIPRRINMIVEIKGKRENGRRVIAEVIDAGTHSTPDKELGEVFDFNTGSPQHDAMQLCTIQTEEPDIIEMPESPMTFDDIFKEE